MRRGLSAFLFYTAVMSLLLGPAGSKAGGQEMPEEDDAPDFDRGSWTYETIRETELQDARFQDRVSSVYLSGTVVLADGSPPPASAVIESVCGGRVRLEGRTDSKGRFSFLFGQSNEAQLAASVRNGPLTHISQDELPDCTLRASLAGYLSGVLPLERRLAPNDNANVGRIVLYRFGEGQGNTVSVTSLAAPKNAKKAYDKGLDAGKKRRWADARKQLELAVKEYPRYAAAWYELGLVAEQLRDMDAAREAYAKSLESDKQFVQPYLRLADILAASENWQEVADVTSRLLRLDPYNYPGMYYLESVARFKLRQVEQAERSARQAVKLDRQNLFPGANYLLGLILSARGQLADAAGFLRTYLRLAPTSSDAVVARQQLAEIEAIAANGEPPVQPLRP